MIFYFSGTGNSKGIAQLLAERMQEEAVDIIGTEPERYTFSPADRVGFVFPVYGYVAPKVMLAFAKKIRTSGAYTYAVPTFSNAAGCTLEHFSQTACHLAGGFGIKMPDNMPVFDKIVETRETALEKLRLARDRYDWVAAQIETRAEGFDIHYGPTPEDNTWKMGVKFLETPAFSTKPFHIHEDRCIGCGICSALCPADAIVMKNDRPEWAKDICCICMGCLNHCPTEAIEYGEFSEGQYRYMFRGFDPERY